MIKKVKIYNDGNNQIGKDIAALLIKNDFEISNTKPDLAIAVGGDGSFLKMVKANNYSEDIIYVGINTGTLGFLQEVQITELDKLIEVIKKAHPPVNYLGIQETEIRTEGETTKLLSLNEIVIREINLKTTYMEIKIDHQLLEKYIGDGLLISTSVGSTAYNLSFGGSIVDNDFHILQITPIAPLNSKVHDNLLNSVIIPQHKTISIQPFKYTKHLIITVDGENTNFKNVKAITTKVGSTKIKTLRMENYNYWQKVNSKFLHNS